MQIVKASIFHQINITNVFDSVILFIFDRDTGVKVIFKMIFKVLDNDLVGKLFTRSNVPIQDTVLGRLQTVVGVMTVNVLIGAVRNRGMRGTSG